MKFNIKYITFSALLCASMVSCDLDVVPPSDISTETFWKNEKDAWNGLNALYARNFALLHLIFSASNHSNSFR